MKRKIDAEIKIEEEVTRMYVGSTFKANARIDGLNFVKNAIDDMSDVDMKLARGWTFCFESLPNHRNEVLIAYYEKANTKMTHIGISRLRDYGFACIQKRLGWVPPFPGFHDSYEVFAWMELPDPPKTKGENK